MFLRLHAAWNLFQFWRRRRDIVETPWCNAGHDREFFGPIVVIVVVVVVIIASCRRGRCVLHGDFFSGSSSSRSSCGSGSMGSRGGGGGGYRFPSFSLG